MTDVIGNAVAGAAWGGLMIAKERQQRAAFNSWVNYSKHLEKKVLELEEENAFLKTRLQNKVSSIEDANSYIKTLEKSSEVYKSYKHMLEDHLRQQTSRADHNFNVLTARNATISTLQDRLKKESDRADKNYGIAKRLESELRQIKKIHNEAVEHFFSDKEVELTKYQDLEYTLLLQSKSTFFFNKLYNALVEEISHLENFENLKSINQDFFYELIKEWTEFEKTNKLIYKCTFHDGTSLQQRINNIKELTRA